MRIESGVRASLAAGAIVGLALVGCAAEAPGSPDLGTMTPVPTEPAPPATGGAVLDILDDGEYRAAVYDPAGAQIAGDPDADDLAAGTLVDLGGGCLGLEDDTGKRRIVAFPVGTTLADGRISAVGMDSFGLGQPLRYLGANGRTTEPVASLTVPDGCPPDIITVWFFIVPSSVGIDSPGDD